VTSVEKLADDSRTPYDQSPLAYASNFDSSKAPLKHLGIVPADYTKETVDIMMDRLLDERLAEDDPFQATMGLVFLSQLGLKWDSE
jgi:hypothetical protein